MKKKSTQSRGGVKGGFPLAGSRGGAPCGAWGNAPTVARQNYSKGTANKAQAAKRPCQELKSLPIQFNLHGRRPPKESRGRSRTSFVFFALWKYGNDQIGRKINAGCLKKQQSLIVAEGFASAEATRGQWKQTKSAGAPLTPSGAPPCFLIFYWKFFSYCPAFFPGFYSFTQGDNHHVRIYRRSCVRKNDQFLSP